MSRPDGVLVAGFRGAAQTGKPARRRTSCSRRDLATVLGARVTWIAASAAALLIGHGFVLALDLYSAASRSVEAHTLLASEFDPLLGILRPTLGGLTLATSLFGPLIGARALAMEKDRRTFYTDVLRVGSAWRFAARKWTAAIVAVALPWVAAALLIVLWRLVGGHVQLVEASVVMGSQLLYAALVTGIGVAAASFSRGVSQAITTALVVVAATWAIDAAEGFSGSGVAGGRCRLVSYDLSRPLRARHVLSGFRRLVRRSDRGRSCARSRGLSLRPSRCPSRDRGRRRRRHPGNGRLAAPETPRRVGSHRAAPALAANSGRARAAGHSRPGPDRRQSRPRGQPAAADRE